MHACHMHCNSLKFDRNKVFFLAEQLGTNKYNYCYISTALNLLFALLQQLKLYVANL